MGFWDRLFGGRAKTAEETRFPGEKMVVKAPMDGIVLPLEQLPDETFAAAILGPGCGIEPTGSTVYAPFDGKVTSIVPTLHAMGLESTEGIELLIHIGMDTIALRGSGFTPLVREGQAVKAGTPLLNVDLDAIRAAGLSTESAVIDAGMKRVGVMALAYCISAFMDCTIAASRGLGKTVVPTVIVIMGSCVFRVIWVYTIFAHFHTIPSLYALYPCSWALTALAEIVYFAHCYKESMRIFEQPKAAA